MPMFDDKVEYAKTLVNQDFKSDAACFQKCIILGRYMLYQGKTKEEIYNTIKEKYSVMREILSEVACVLNVNRIMEIIEASGPLSPNPPISFTDKEIEFIRNCGDLVQQKALFVIYCAWKINKCEPVTFKQKYLFDEMMEKWNARLYDTTMYHLVGKNHYVDCKVYKNNLLYIPCEKLQSLDDVGEPVLNIDNYKNIVCYYLEYFGEGKFIRCEDCGCIDKKTSNSKKLCNDCAKTRNNLNKNNYKKRQKNSQIDGGEK